MNILTMNTSGINVLGRLGENDYTQAQFDVYAWLSEYPDGQITLLNQRCGDTDAYPVAGVSVSGSTVLWVVSDTDLSRGGVGRCELILLANGAVAKSAIYMTKVLPALDGSGEAPEPWESWQTEFAALKDEAVAAADDAEAASEAVQDMGVDAVTLEPGSDATVTKAVDPETGAVTLTFGVPAGERGPTPDLTIGTVSTLPAGSDATATITGTPEEPVLNLGLPQGAQGDPGDPGATGNGIASIVKTGTAGLVDTYTITCTDGGTTTYTVTNGAQGQPGQKGDPGEGVASGGTTGQMLVKASNADYATEWVDPPEGEVTQAEFDALKQYVLDMSPVTTVTAPVVSVTDAAPLDAEGLVVDIEPVQSGSGDPSPDNVRPITGWTGAKVTRTRGNLFNVRACTPFNQNITLTFNDDGSMTCENRNDYPVIPTASVVLNLPSGTYTVSTDGTLSANVTFYASDDGVNYAWYANGLNASTKNRTVTLDKPYVQLRWQVPANTTDTLPPIMFEYGSTYHSYEPYQGDTYDITFPAEAGTVYGGTLDVVNGVLTVDRAYASVASVLNKFEDENGYYWYSTSSTLVIPIISGLNAGLISDRFVKIINVSTDNNDGVITFYANGIIRWKEKGDLALADYITYLASNPFQLCYELATPITYTLTPQQIALLRGNNALWADTGDTTLTYRQDVAKLLEALMKPDESDMVASATYAANSFFTIGGTLYKATAAIATGETIQPEVNCVQTTVADQLTAIFAQL